MGFLDPFVQKPQGFLVIGRRWWLALAGGFFFGGRGWLFRPFVGLAGKPRQSRNRQIYLIEILRQAIRPFRRSSGRSRRAIGFFRTVCLRFGNI